MSSLFVTATGTDVGKTYVTAGLIRAGRRAGIAMDALKPVLTGYSADAMADSDAARLLEALGCAITPDAVARIAPWRFAAPLGPNIAAAAEGRSLVFDELAAACRAALRPDCVTLIEGIGGVMVPLDDRRTVLDLIAALGRPVVLVTGPQLGTLSHTLTACAVLQARGQPPGLILLNESGSSTVPLAATRDTLATFCPGISIEIIPRSAEDAVFDALLPTILAIAAAPTIPPASPSRGRQTAA